MASSRQTTTLQNSLLEVVFIASLSCSLHCATDSSKVMENGNTTSKPVSISIHGRRRRGPDLCLF